MQKLITNKTIEKLKYDLVRDGLISYEDLSKADETARSSNANLAQVLIRLNMLSEEVLLSFIEAKLHIPCVNLDEYRLDENCLAYISQKDARKYKIIPLFKIEDVLTVAMADPLDLFAINNLINSINCKIEPIICSERTIIQAIDTHYKCHDSNISNLPPKHDAKFNWQNELGHKNNNDSQPQKIIEAIFHQANIEDAEEVAFEPSSDGIKILFRQDGKLSGKGYIPLLLSSLCISRLKAISSLDSNILELPQLGKLKFTDSSVAISGIISSFPTIRGERITVKLNKAPKQLSELFDDPDKLNLVKKCLNKHGIILVCGSNAHYRASVTYSLLSSINSENKNIMTIESVIKYELPEINQCELNEKTEFNFDKAVRLIYFQSPDVIYLEGCHDKQGLDYISAFSGSGKLVIAELHAGNSQAAAEKLRNSEYENFKNQISCIIFAESKNKAEIISNKSDWKIQRLLSEEPEPLLFLPE